MPAMDHNSHLFKVLRFTSLFSISCIYLAFTIQNKASRATRSCSYLDPIAVDIWATLFALFLILEGFWDIFIHKQYLFKDQFTKSIRVGLGFAILTIHLMQFIHK